MRTNTPFAILSAERPEYTSEVNQWRSRSLESQLASRDMDQRQLQGVYKGTNERSFLVLLPGGETGYHYATGLPQLARRWGQESWLYVDANRFASLHYADGRIEALGVWQAATRADAVAADGHTYDPGTGLYFVVRRAS
jgi:hypothetical protein